MSSKRLRRVGLSKEVLDCLSKNSIYSCKDLLSKTKLELLKFLGLGIFKVDEVVQLCSKACAPKPQTCLELWNKRKEKGCHFFQTSLPDLDNVLHGGIPTGTITEISGPAGCGKTQFCLMLTVQCTLPLELGGLAGNVLYIDTESAFSAERLVEIAQAKHPDLFVGDKLVELTSQVFVDTQQTCASLMERLQTIEEEIIQKRVKLVIVDSMASLVRKEYSTSLGRNLTDRTNFLSQQAALLKYIAETFSIPVVVTNQITTRYDRQDDVSRPAVQLDGETGYVTTALGNTWSHSVNTRLILQYHTDLERQIMVAKSPIAPFTIFTYTIQQAGLVQKEGGAGHYSGTDPGKQKIQVKSALRMEDRNTGPFQG
ncbi:DNA repair protein RAD51 homolog 2-like isoform X2 [Pecten maximus]|uniref:DNA repair protein RAD51 homolog 2-like isoform X2 n=1 Tax=Pecten maximus TaxID=6579 RepID=UPI001458115C|nr:DNA repair protein RAD51 homolog 2-like isoform X2 [Pecten maximus]